MSFPHTMVSSSRTVMNLLNTKWHKCAQLMFLFIVLAHLAEHIVQLIQIYVLGWPIPEARGIIGVPFPWLIKSEWLHYGYAVVMLVLLVALRPGFVGRARTWWTVAMVIQVWHFCEHFLLLLQAMYGWHLLGRPEPTSFAQLFFPRVELHFFYNTVVFFPMAVAMVLHMLPNPAERALMRCTCAGKVPARAAA